MNFKNYKNFSLIKKLQVNLKDATTREKWPKTERISCLELLLEALEDVDALVEPRLLFLGHRLSHHTDETVVFG